MRAWRQNRPADRMAARERGRAGPRAAKTKVYRPHVEKLMAARGDVLSKDVMLAAMRRHFQARRYDEAARIAALVAPYIHPRLTSSAITVRPRLSEMSDEELATFIEEARQDAGITEDELASFKPRGNA